MKKSVKTLSVLLAAIFLFSFAAPLTVGAKTLYSDVEAGRWSEGSIEYASENGYMQGVGGGRFDPEGSMTRAMVVTVLWRIDGRPAAGKSTFSDVPDGEWYSEPVAWAESTGVVTGVGGGRFDPDGVITREQLATILYRYCGFKKLDVSEKGDVSAFTDKDKIDAWATDAVRWAVGIGLIRGVTAKTVDPLGSATREQVAAILERFDKTEFVNLVDLFAPVVEEVADYAEKMLDDCIAEYEKNPSVDISGSMPGTLLIGLIEASRWDAVKNYIDFWIGTGKVDITNEFGLTGYALICLYEKTGDESYLPLIESLRKQTDEWPTDVLGELKYDNSWEHQDIYVDGTGMFTPFLAKYAELFGDEETADLARLQVSNYFKCGINRVTERVYHGYQNGGLYQGEDGWGRGTGWFMFALGTVLKYCPDDATAERSVKFIDKTMKYRLDDGRFPWSFSEPRESAPSDSSATGMIMWGVMKAKENGRFGNVSLDEITRSAKALLPDVHEGGVVRGTSGPSGGWGAYNSDGHGNYNTTYDENNGWGQGGVLAFLASYVNYLNS
ncbi:MAG: S-layer homology domain-containing protein [Clostridia bacterium]|nr:S-layer homology domain-containing protein [Clostridia bacterium]